MHSETANYNPIFAWTKEQDRVGSDIDLHLEEIRRDGLTLIPNALTKVDTDTIRQKMEEIYKVQVEECGGEENLRKIGDQHNAKALLAYDPYFDRFLRDATLLTIVKSFLGDYFILHQQNGIFHRPNSANTTHPWHRDIVYQHFTTSRPIGITALYCVTDYTVENGGTSFLHGSHLHEALPSTEYTLKHQKQICAPAGSVIIFNSMVFHRGGYNHTQDTRYSLNLVFTLPCIKQQISYPNILRGKFQDEPEMRKLLGFNCETEPTVQSARMNKINQTREFEGWKLEKR